MSFLAYLYRPGRRWYLRTINRFPIASRNWLYKLNFEHFREKHVEKLTLQPVIFTKKVRTIFYIRIIFKRNQSNKQRPEILRLSENSLMTFGWSIRILVWPFSLFYYFCLIVSFRVMKQWPFSKRSKLKIIYPILIWRL